MDHLVQNTLLQNNLVTIPQTLVQTNLTQTHLGLDGEPAAEPIPAGFMLNFDNFIPIQPIHQIHPDTIGVTRQLQNISVDEIPSARRCSLSINEPQNEKSDEK